MGESLYQLGAGVKLRADDLPSIAENGKLDLSTEARERVKRSYEELNELSKRELIYGVNTGFGDNAKTRVDNNQLSELQVRLILSHAAGSGPEVPPLITRMAQVARIHSLAMGYSGVSLELLEFMIKLFNEGVVPLVPRFGSVGASGDLIPLAHIALPIIGYGRVRLNGQEMSSEEALRRLNLKPYSLRPKEGLALINGTSFSVALSVSWLILLKKLLKYLELAHALSMIALKGLEKHLDNRIAQLKPHPGLKEAFSSLNDILKKASWSQANWETDRVVQDPYTLRCSPHLYGYLRQFLDFAQEVIETELNSVTDNPLITERTALEGGNFHGYYLSAVSDHARVLMSALGEVSFWRTSRLLDRRFNRGLPHFLIPNPGLDSGFMISHYLASSLNAELKHLATPVSSMNFPVSAMQEDWVSYSQSSAWLTLESLERVIRILAIELMVSAQALQIRRENGERIALSGELKETFQELVELFPDTYRKSDLEEPIYLLQGRFIKWLKSKLGWRWDIYGELS